MKTKRDNSDTLTIKFIQIIIYFHKQILYIKYIDKTFHNILKLSFCLNYWFIKNENKQFRLSLDKMVQQTDGQARKRNRNSETSTCSLSLSWSGLQLCTIKKGDKKMGGKVDDFKNKAGLVESTKSVYLNME